MGFADVTYLYEFSLTRSSSAVRLGARTGACGTLGSLPRFGGKGSSSKPLHTSFREDIPSGPVSLSVLWSSLESEDGWSTTTGEHPSLHPAFKTHQWRSAGRYVFGIYWFPECLKRRMQQKTNIATDHGPRQVYNDQQSNNKKKTLYQSSKKVTKYLQHNT